MNRKASILIMAMWMLVLFTILGTAIYRMFSSQITIAKHLQERSLSYFIARAAVLDARKELRENKKSYVGLADLRKIRAKDLSTGSFEYYFLDEESKLNVNTASTDFLSKLPGLDRDLAQKIAESALKPFSVKEELLLVDGMTPEIYSLLKDCVTIFGYGVVNMNTAPSEVLFSLGMDEDLISKINFFRYGIDGVEGTEDDKAFESQGDIISILKDNFFISSSQEALLNNLMNAQRIGVGGSYYTLVLNIKFMEKSIGKYDITINEGSIIQWREF